MTRWYTSDEHYGHANIIAYCGRPFKTLHEMNSAMTDRHNARVRDNDEVIHLGDFSLSERYVETVLPRLHGKHTLIMGNHDKCWKDAKALERYRTHFVEVVREMHRVIGPYRAYLNHMPLRDTPVPYDERHEPSRPGMDDMGNASVLIHGHVHEKWRTRGKMINVGVDVHNFAPVSEDELVAIIHEVVR
jgi:calcineurin-like phosphoesterase family protein